MNERIKEIRKKEGLSQQKFADKLGIARGNIAAYEVGKNAPSDAVVSLICSKFNVNEEWLRSGNGEMRKYSDSDDYVEIVAIIDEKDPKARQAIIDYYHLNDSDKKLWWEWVERFLKRARD